MFAWPPASGGIPDEGLTCLVKVRREDVGRQILVAFFNWLVVGCWLLVVGCRRVVFATNNQPPTNREKN
jgi:hypothetical protein